MPPAAWILVQGTSAVKAPPLLDGRQGPGGAARAPPAAPAPASRPCICGSARRRPRSGAPSAPDRGCTRIGALCHTLSHLLGGEAGRLQLRRSVKVDAPPRSAAAVGQLLGHAERLVLKRAPRRAGSSLGLYALAQERLHLGSGVPALRTDPFRVEEVGLQGLQDGAAWVQQSSTCCLTCATCSSVRCARCLVAPPSSFTGLSLLFVNPKPLTAHLQRLLFSKCGLRKFVGFARCGHSPSACTSARVFRLLQWVPVAFWSRKLKLKCCFCL